MSRNKVVQRLKITNESDFVLNDCDHLIEIVGMTTKAKTKAKANAYICMDNEKTKASTYDHNSSYCIKRHKFWVYQLKIFIKTFSA